MAQELPNPNVRGPQDESLIESPLHQYESTRKQRHYTAWAGLFVLVLGSFLAVENGVMNLRASVLPTKQAPAFDGAVYPVAKTPNWVKLKGEEYKYTYEQLPSEKFIETPPYNAANLERSVDTLKWGNPADDYIRNQKITYSVPYMGSYRLNGKEFDGSHLAVDIKVPTNTPVRSIANGVVTKVASQTSGYGKHIVIEHRDVPSVENPAVKTTYYSSYSHLTNILITEGDVVLRGQNIALSGSTGFATTPHIHFQIDKAEAPWHPYWPFTYQEQNAAGLDFVGAVNAGLGKDKALLNTVHPLTFIQSNLTSAPAAQPVVDAPVVTPTPEPAPIPAPQPAPVPPVSTPTPTPVTTNNDPIFTITNKTSFHVGEDVKLTISVKDKAGSALTQFNGSALILLSGDVGILSKANIISDDIYNGPFVLQLLNPKAGHGQVTVLYNDAQYKSEPFDIIQPATATPEVEKPVVVSTKRPRLFADVSGTTSYYDAIRYMKQRSVFGGYSDGTFRPDQVISRVEVLKVAMKSANRPLLNTSGVLAYSDVDPSGWYIPYIATAQQNGIMQGYVGGYFRPNQNVTRAEFLKILLLASPVSIRPDVLEKPYTDVERNDWYAVFAQFALEKNLLPDTSRGFEANKEITRGEVAEIIYRLLLVINSGSQSYTAALGNS